MKNLIKLIIAVNLILISFNIHSQSKEVNSGNPVITQDFVDEISNRKFEYVENNNSIGLNSLRNKIVIIDFWQTWCKPCLVGFKSLQSAKEKWPDKLEILAASPDWADNKRKISKFIKSKGYDFHFIWAKALTEEIGIKSIPYQIIISPKGKLIETKTGSGSEQKEFEHIEKLVQEYFNEPKKN